MIECRTRKQATAVLAELRRCRNEFPRFAGHTSILVGAGDAADWGSFRLWPAQHDAAARLQAHRLVVLLKARQLGFTYLLLAFGLWHLLLHPVATVLLFSRRETEARDLLDRLRAMHDRLPSWLQASEAEPDSAHAWQLPSGSRALAFPTTAGDSYSATLAIVDEADLLPDGDQAALMRAVKPTIDGGGRMILLSRPDKSRPESPFKRVYRAARAGENDWHPIFAPWQADPRRDPDWYEAQRRDVLSRTGSLDDLHEQYPASEAEALSPRTLAKRIPAAWLEACSSPRLPIPGIPDAPALPLLEVYAPPKAGGRYILGADPAEGNPTSDDSALCVLDVRTGEECAALAGKVPPEVLADYAAALCLWYNRAPALIERNNHGFAVLLALKGRVRLLEGRDGRPGWLSSSLGNVALYDACAEAVRNGEVVIHSLATFAQLAALDGATLAAPPGGRDDRADAFALANVGRRKANPPLPVPPGGGRGRNVLDRARAGGALPYGQP